MQLDLNIIKKGLFNNKFVTQFISELEKSLTKKENRQQENTAMYEYERKSTEFLQNFFNERKDTFIVHRKYNDDPMNRYKIAKYKDNKQYLSVTYKDNLPNDVEIGDIIVKQPDGNYYRDDNATKYVQANLQKIKEKSNI